MLALALMRSASKCKAALRPSPVKLDPIANKPESFVNLLAELLLQ